MNVFITGTDTDAGKTTVSSWICSKVHTKYWKLIQTGMDSDSATVHKFAPHTEIIPETYNLKAPLSPYDAALLESVKIDTDRFRTKLDKIIIEGAGGLFVPIAENFYMIDAIQNTNSAALLVVRSKLGMINHILLSIFAMKSRKIPIIGIIICGNLQKNLKQTIEHFSQTKILAVLEESNNLNQLIDQKPLPQEILEILS